MLKHEAAVDRLQMLAAVARGNARVFERAAAGAGKGTTRDWMLAEQKVSLGMAAEYEGAVGVLLADRERSAEEVCGEEGG